VRHGYGPHRCGTDPVPPVVAGLRGTHGLARCPEADLGGQFGDRGIGHGVDPGSGCSLSEIVSKSACSFACTFTTKRMICSSRASRRGRPRGAANPANAPASRARRHARIWLEYKSSRRSSAPF
jgi:hypothetical protein